METRKRITAIVITALLTVGMTLNFSGCSKESTMGPTIEEEQSSSVLSLAKGKGSGKGQINNNENGNNSGNQSINNESNSSSENWTKEASKKFKYVKGLGYYKGGNIKINGTQTQFNFEDNSLTPPEDTKFGKSVTITMKMEYNSTDNELIFTFGPHGCKFSPNAKLRLDYKALGVDVADLYYIEDDGSRTLQAPEQVSANKRFVMIKIDHFSRYALAHSE